MSKEKLLEALAPIVKSFATLEWQDAVHLERKWPVSSLQDIRALVRQGVQEGWLADKENGGVRFSRVAKNVEGFSIDVVHMKGPAPGGHTHPNGEIDLCFSVDDDAARFDGRPSGWTAYGKETWHVPTVSNGAMDILYFLPDGKIVFDK